MTETVAILWGKNQSFQKTAASHQEAVDGAFYEARKWAHKGVHRKESIQFSQSAAPLPDGKWSAVVTVFWI